MAAQRSTTWSAAVSDEARSIRRIAAAGVVAVALAGAAALALSLRDAPPPGPVPRGQASGLFPLEFHEDGFVSGVVRLSAARDRSGATRRVVLSVDLPAGASTYVVGQCDSGSVNVAVGSLTSSGSCTATPHGIVVLSGTGRPMQLVATVNRPQNGRWGIAVYRSAGAGS